MCEVTQICYIHISLPSCVLILHRCIFTYRLSLHFRWKQMPISLVLRLQRFWVWWDQKLLPNSRRGFAGAGRKPSGANGDVNMLERATAFCSPTIPFRTLTFFFTTLTPLPTRYFRYTLVSSCKAAQHVTHLIYHTGDVWSRQNGVCFALQLWLRMIPPLCWVLSDRASTWTYLRLVCCSLYQLFKLSIQVKVVAL